MAVATQSTLIRDLSGLKLSHDPALAHAFYLPVDTTNGLNGAYSTQKIDLNGVRDYVLNSSTDKFAYKLGTSTIHDVILANNSNVNVGVGVTSIPSNIKLAVNGNVTSTGYISASQPIYGPQGVEKCFVGNASTATKWRTGITVSLAGGQLSGAGPAGQCDGTGTYPINGGLVANTVQTYQLKDLGSIVAGDYAMSHIGLTQKGTISSCANAQLSGHVHSTSQADNLNIVITDDSIVNSMVSLTAAITDT